MEKKKLTRDQLERRINNSLVFVPRDKDYISVYFSDKGLRIEATKDNCVISTNFHKHVFDAYNTATIVSRPYIYTKRLIEISLENDCKSEDGYSFAKLLDTLKGKEDKTEYNIVVYVDWWITNCFQPLYSIGESEVESFLVYESYLHNIARNAVLIGEKNEDMTNRKFFANVIKNMQDFIEGVDERVIFHKKSDEELAKESIEELQNQMYDDAIDGQGDGTKD